MVYFYPKTRFGQQGSKQLQTGTSKAVAKVRVKVRKLGVKHQNNNQLQQLDNEVKNTNNASQTLSDTHELKQ